MSQKTIVTFQFRYERMATWVLISPVVIPRLSDFVVGIQVLNRIFYIRMQCKRLKS